MVRRAVTCVLVSAVLFGCSSKAKPNPDLGDINDIVLKLSARDCRSKHAGGICIKHVRDRECGCYLTVDLDTEKNSPHVNELRLVIGNCSHDEGVREAYALLGGMVPSELLGDLERVEGPFHRTYGAVSADVTWSPDVFQIGTKQEPQTTESFQVVVRPKDGKPDTQSKLAAPTITKPPDCDPRKEDMASIGAGPVVVTPFKCGDPVTSLPAYAIDKQRVSCDAYRACIAAKACRDEGWKCGDTAIARLDAATAYCQWRAARLPSVAEYQRAVRGPKGDKYPTGGGWLVSEGCKDATTKHPRTLEPMRCRNVSADGVEYFVLDAEAFEWTRDFGCGKPVGANTYDETLDRAGPRGQPDEDMGTFRCAR